MTILRVLPVVVLAAFGLCAQTPPFLFDVKQFGAAGTPGSTDTVAISKAIAAASAAGGGTVYFPPGRYVSGTVRLKDNITLWLDSGATLVGSKDLSSYQTGVDGDVWFSALILGRSVHHVALIGRGVVDGARVSNPNGEEHIRGPHAFLCYDCQDVTVRDLSFRDAGNYAVLIRSSEGVNVDGITVRGGWDGIHMRDVRNATISNCRLFTGDDAIAGNDWENATVTNCLLNASANAIRVGGRNVLFNNLVIWGPGESEHGTSLRHRLEAGFQILPNRSGVNNKYVTPGPVDNMVLSNITMINLETPFFVADSADAPYSASSLGIGRIVINNMTVLRAGKTALAISSPPNRPAKSLVLNHVRMTFVGGSSDAEARGQGFSPFSILPSYAVFARNVEHVELHDVRVDTEGPDSRAPIFAENVGLLELDRFQPAGEPVIGTRIARLLADGQPAMVRAPGVTLAVGSGETVGGKVQPPFLTAHNTASEMRQLDSGFYIRAGGDSTVMQYGDQYGAIYRAQALRRNGSVVVKMENPDARTHWPGRAGIMVRGDISKPGTPGAYLILSSSPAAGTYLEWDADGDGRLDKHTEFEGNTLWPHWLKLDRRGDTFTGYVSSNGHDWTRIGQAELPGASPLLDAGMFAFRDSARFENFSISEALP